MSMGLVQSLEALGLVPQHRHVPKRRLPHVQALFSSCGDCRSLQMSVGTKTTYVRLEA